MKGYRGSKRRNAEGVISLFLAILMLPFVSIGGILINTARVNSAVAIFDEALCNASNSTLGTYDDFLRKRFGLLAMSQNTSSKGSGYTAQNLISDTFQYYMKKNTEALSNTYFGVEADAAGIYPLADTNVLLSQVCEYGKYAIPAKIVVDGLCIDDIIGSLTKKTKLLQKVLGVVTDGVDIVTNYDDCQNKYEVAQRALEELDNAKEDYVIAYSDFKNATIEYNDLLKEMENKVSECEQKLTAATENGAEEEIDTAEAELDATVVQYQKRLDQQRIVVAMSRQNYILKVEDFASKTKSAKDTVVNLQDAMKRLMNSGARLVKDGIDATVESKNEAINNEKEEIKERKQNAIENGVSDRDILAQYDTQIQKVENYKTENQNVGIVSGGTVSGATEGVNVMTQFTANKLADKFDELYTTLRELQEKTTGYVVSDGYETKMPDTNYYYYDLSSPLTAGEMIRIMTDLAADVTRSSFFACAKALVSFIKAIVKLDSLVNWELCAEINPAMYDEIGGLPSEKRSKGLRSEGSRYCLKSEFENEDSKQSDYYKQLLGSYSGGTGASDIGDVSPSAFEQVKADIDKLMDCFDGWNFFNVFIKLKNLFVAGMNLAKHMVALFQNVATLLAEAVWQKLFLSGYVAYNVPNRTTYTGKALTGGSYMLPSRTSSPQGYAFFGAETEYIMMGNKSELLNQSLVFAEVWLIRFLFDVGFVLMNPEVGSIAAEAGGATFGIGTVVIYLLYIIAEPFVDTLVLVNGGTVPIWKTNLYLTPGGIMDFIGQMVKLKLPEDEKNQAYQDVVKVMSMGKASDRFAQNYADAYQSGIGKKDPTTSDKIRDSMTFDYTKTLLLAMLFANKEDMLDRLADVIQMEASYYAISTSPNGTEKSYTFNLDNSYTYLRSSGSFTTNEFIPVSDFAGRKTKTHVIYRGY